VNLFQKLTTPHYLFLMLSWRSRTPHVSKPASLTDKTITLRVREATIVPLFSPRERTISSDARVVTVGG